MKRITHCAFISVQHFWFYSSRIISTNHMQRSNMQYCKTGIMDNVDDGGEMLF